jgi:hypothetical protein
LFRCLFILPGKNLISFFCYIWTLGLGSIRFFDDLGFGFSSNEKSWEYLKGAIGRVRYDLNLDVNPIIINDDSMTPLLIGCSVLLVFCDTYRLVCGNCIINLIIINHRIAYSVSKEYVSFIKNPKLSLEQVHLTG